MQRDDKRKVYLDNAATTWPKPEGVYRAMDRFAREVGGNPGRSGHEKALEAGREVLRCRESLAALLGVSDPSRIVFTKNATEALNLVLLGRLRRGGHVIITSVEHNSVWRPVRALRCMGADYSIAECGPDGTLDPHELAKLIRIDTRLIACTHASNVLGSLLPVREIARIASEHDIALLVDAAQTAGRYPIDVEEAGIQYLAFTGHKELFGPQGTGGLYIAPGWEVEPLTYGGTGSLSESAEQPGFLPDRYESGTLNAWGLAGLRAGVDFVSHWGVERIREHDKILTERLLDGLESLEKVRIYGPRTWEHRIGVVSFNLEGISSSDLAYLLDERYGICVRSGLHCSPLAHATAGTLREGTVRVSFSFLNTVEEVDYLIRALEEIVSMV